MPSQAHDRARLEVFFRPRVLPEDAGKGCCTCLVLGSNVTHRLSHFIVITTPPHDTYFGCLSPLK